MKVELFTLYGKPVCVETADDDTTNWKAIWADVQAREIDAAITARKNRQMEAEWSATMARLKYDSAYLNAGMNRETNPYREAMEEVLNRPRQ